ncbi:MAG: hypothetical protein AAGH40_13700 [Verrucomicrobiota bacterium]
MNRLPVVFSLFLLTLSAWATNTSLVLRSPFIPHKEKAVEKTEKARPAESLNHPFKLKGVISLNGRYYFSVLDSKSGKSEWIDPSEVINGFNILNYDPVTHVLEYEWNGSLGSIELELMETLGFVTREQKKNTYNSPNKVENHTDEAVVAAEDRLTQTTKLAEELVVSEGIISDSTKVYFRRSTGGKRSKGSTNFSSVVSDGDSSLFAQSSIQNLVSEISVSPENQPEPRYKVKRKNSVYNPSGTLPEGWSVPENSPSAIQPSI